MKTFLFTAITVGVLPAVCHGQSDLRKFGNFLQQLQGTQQQNGQQQGGGQQGTTQPFKVDPNSSGNRNQGNFDGRGFFAPSNNMNQPQYIQPQPQYQQGGQLNQPQKNVYPNQPTPIRKVYSNQPIKILCDSSAQGTCNYELISGSNQVFRYAIKGGQTQNLTENTNWALRYRPTPSSPYKTYSLRGGKTYELRESGNSWQCYRLK